MAASSQPTDSWFALFDVIPQETLRDPFDVTLVVEDGKEFKAHRRVLSEASPFFEKLLNSDMRESNEGVLRLQMLTELGMRDVLEFIYTGSVQISDTANNAQELIVMADYLDLPHLKTLAETILLNYLNASNVISTYYFAEKYRCEKLIFVSKSFILTSFDTVAKMEEFLNLSNEEVKIWISSDDINVSAEEDVFKIILNWVDHARNERKKYFTELFHNVRLVYVSRDYLRKKILRNNLVNVNEGCMDLVKNAMEFIDSKEYPRLCMTPRKSLEIPVLVVSVRRIYGQDHILCYDPREDRWSRFGGPIPPGPGEVISCHGKFYFVSRSNIDCLKRYDSLSDWWTSLPISTKRKVEKVVTYENKIYAWVTEERKLRPDCASTVFKVHSHDDGLFDSSARTMRLSFITKYKPETSSWEDIASFDLGSREAICVVAKDSSIYFVGGRYSTTRHENGGQDIAEGIPEYVLRYADRYDLNTNTWDEIADLQEPRRHAFGAAAYGKIFIAGGGWPHTCEVYTETTNTWQYTKGPCPFNDALALVCVDGKLYRVENGWIGPGEVECYDPDSNQWKEVTHIPLEITLLERPWWDSDNRRFGMWWSMRFFRGYNYIEKDGGSKCKCSIM